MCPARRRHGAGRFCAAGIRNAGTLTLTDVVVSGNLSGYGAYAQSGGELCNVGTARILRSTIRGNGAGDGGGITLIRK